MDTAIIIFIIICASLIYLATYKIPRPSSKMEKYLFYIGRCWEQFRKMIFFLLAVLLCFGVYFVWTSNSEITYKIIYTLVLLTTSTVSIYCGVYGIKISDLERVRNYYDEIKNKRR